MLCDFRQAENKHLHLKKIPLCLQTQQPEGSRITAITAQATNEVTSVYPTAFLGIFRISPAALPELTATL